MSGSIYLAASEVSTLESDGRATVFVRRDGDASAPVTVLYGVTADGATEGADFSGGFGSVTIAAGEASASIDVDVFDDDEAEPTETVIVSLINITSGTLTAPRTVRVDILDDETPVVDMPVPPLVSDYDVSREVVIDGLARPIDFAVSPDGRVYVAEKAGLVRAFDARGTDLGTVLDLTERVNDRQDRGLLDIVLDPGFPGSPYLYASYIVDPPEAQGLEGNAGPNGGGNRYGHVVRFELAADGLSVVPGSETILLGAAGRSYADVAGGGAADYTNPDQSDRIASDRSFEPGDGGIAVVDGVKQDYWKVDARSHAGGALAFGPDGALYVSTGDGTSYNYADPRTVDVQSLDTLSGKILRIDPATGDGFADNPFAEPGGDLSLNRAKVYQSGLRNPFSMGFDDEGRLFITDTGWNSYEELNRGDAGANFGWPFYEGGDAGILEPTPGYRDTADAQAFYDAVDAGGMTVTPAYRAFSHADRDPGFQVQAITGGNAFLDAPSYPEALRGDYVFVDVSQSEVFAIDADDRREVSYLYTSDAAIAPVHFGEGPDGTVWYADLVRSHIGRLVIDEIATPEPVAAVGEVGRVTVATTARDAWTQVTFAQTIEDAVVVAGPPSAAGWQPGMVRIRNVTESGFEMQFEEWAFLDGYHLPESVAWMALERGEHVIDGAQVAAGTATVDDAFTTVDTGVSLDGRVVLGQLNGVADPAPATHRIWDVGTGGGTSFVAQVQEEEGSADPTHSDEELDWIAWETDVLGLHHRADRTADVVDHTDFTFDFGDEVEEAALFADMQTRNGADTTAVRLRAQDDGGATLFLQEEWSRDFEVRHLGESVGWLALETGLLYG